MERLRALEYIPKTHIDFFEYIFQAHYQAKDRLAADKIYPPMSQDRVQEILTQGMPLINFNQMNIRAEPLRDHFMELSTILKKCAESDSARMESFIVSESCNHLDLKELIHKTIFRDPDYLLHVCGQADIDANTLEFIALTLARPLFELAAGDMKDFLAEYPWWRNYCPACGGIPFMTRIRREDGMRILRCSLCAVEWKFDRVKCPFCNNEDQKSLKFFFYHESSPYRLYVCDCCKRYIKCVDERRMDQTRTVNLAMEDIATLFFDVLAREKGYLPPSLSMDISGRELTPCPEKHNPLN
ncbi:MAG: formate dehydrogenase accessory protein FdhE [bacterium]